MRYERAAVRPVRSGSGRLLRRSSAASTAASGAASGMGDAAEEDVASLRAAGALALQVLGANITNSSEPTDVCCLMREAGVNTSALWPWDCEDIHLCAKIPGFQLPTWAKAIILTVVLCGALVASTVGYIRWDHKRKKTRVAQMAAGGAQRKPKRPKARLGLGEKKKDPAPDFAPVAPTSSGAESGGAEPQGEEAAAASKLARRWGGVNAREESSIRAQLERGANPDDVGRAWPAVLWPPEGGQQEGGDSAAVALAAEDEDYSAERDVEEARAAEGSAAEALPKTRSPDRARPAPEPEPEPPSWGILDGWQYHPGEQEKFRRRVEELKAVVKEMTAHGDKVRQKFAQPAYRTGMIEGQDQVVHHFEQATEIKEKKLMRRMRQLEQNLGAEVSDDEDEQKERRRVRAEREKQAKDGAHDPPNRLPLLPVGRRTRC